jgi:hypothetical protein
MMTDKLSVQMSLSPEEYGALIACVGHAAEKLAPGQNREFLNDLEDALRDAQRKFLGPMGIADGMRLTRAIQASERQIKQWLPR